MDTDDDDVPESEEDGAFQRFLDEVEEELARIPPEEHEKRLAYILARVDYGREVEVKVERWYAEGGRGVDVWVYLGWSEQEYVAWVADSSLPYPGGPQPN